MRRSLQLWIMTALFAGCIHSAPVPDAVKSSAPGFGSSRQRPTGRLLVFPEGIEVVGKPRWDTECMNEALQEKRIYGNGGAVRFCIRFSNSRPQPITVTIPAGTVFISVDDESQNGLVVQTIRVTVPPLSAPSFYFLNNCINEDRDITGYSDEFEPQPIVTDHTPILELTDLLRSKRINSEDYHSSFPPSQISAPVQTAVHEIAHTGRMSATTRAKLDQLPAR